LTAASTKIQYLQFGETSPKESNLKGFISPKVTAEPKLYFGF